LFDPPTSVPKSPLRTRETTNYLTLISAIASASLKPLWPETIKV
jgi:hypothetical protein